MMMNENNESRRLPAEWEMRGAVLLAWPHADTDWAYMLDDVRRCFASMVEAITRWAPVVVVAPDISEPKSFLCDGKNDRVFFLEAPTNDTWARDYGPLSVMNADGAYTPLDFRFNGWGLKFASCHDNMVNRAMQSARLLTVELEQHQDFVLEGGGMESDGEGTLMTTAHCQLSPNRNPMLSRQEIEQRLLGYFGGRKLIWLEHGYLAGDDTDSHIDTLARFAPGRTIVFTGCDDPADEHYAELQAMELELREATDAHGNPFNLIRLPLPEPIYDTDGQRLPATYANFLALPDAVIMPVYGQPRNDMLAQQMLQVAFDVPVVTVDCRPLIQQHGSLHCMTMQIPSEILAI